MEREYSFIILIMLITIIVNALILSFGVPIICAEQKANNSTCALEQHFSAVQQKNPFFDTNASNTILGTSAIQVRPTDPTTPQGIVGMALGVWDSTVGTALRNAGAFGALVIGVGNAATAFQSTANYMVNTMPNGDKNPFALAINIFVGAFSFMQVIAIVFVLFYAVGLIKWVK